MSRTRICTSVFTIVFVLLSAFAAFAQDAAPQKPAEKPAQALPDSPKAKAPATAVKTPVAVEHKNTDVVGTRMVYHLKELLGRSSLMGLSSKDEKKLVLVVKTREEFLGRPAVSSIYSVSWLYSAKSGSLRYFLTGVVGIADAASVDQAVEAVITKTSSVAETYSYLFK